MSQKINDVEIVDPTGLAKNHPCGCSYSSVTYELNICRNRVGGLGALQEGTEGR